MGCLIKMNRSKNLINHFNSLITLLPDNFNQKEFEKIFFSLFKKTNWGRDIINFLYMLRHLGYIEIKLKKWKDRLL